MISSGSFFLFHLNFSPKVHFWSGSAQQRLLLSPLISPPIPSPNQFPSTNSSIPGSSPSPAFSPPTPHPTFSSCTCTFPVMNTPSFCHCIPSPTNCWRIASPSFDGRIRMEEGRWEWEGKSSCWGQYGTATSSTYRSGRWPQSPPVRRGSW